MFLCPRRGVSGRNAGRQKSHNVQTFSRGIVDDWLHRFSPLTQTWVTDMTASQTSCQERRKQLRIKLSRFCFFDYGPFIRPLCPLSMSLSWINLFILKAQDYRTLLTFENQVLIIITAKKLQIELNWISTLVSLFQKFCVSAVLYFIFIPSISNSYLGIFKLPNSIQTHQDGEIPTKISVFGRF